jgi:hypothetical protein
MHLFKSKRLWLSIPLLVLVVVAFFLRFVQLDSVPPGLHFDEGAYGFDALSILAGNHMPFSWEGGGRETLFAYMISLGVTIFGREALAIRFPAALASSGAVVGVAYLGMALFASDSTKTSLEKSKPWLIGVLAAALLATSLNQVIIGRGGWRANYLILILPFAVAFLWQGFRTRNWRLLVAAGIATGLLPYTYIPARLFPLVLLFFVLSGFWLGQIRMTEVRRMAGPVAIYLLTSGLVALPILLFFLFNPDAFFYRSQYVWILDENITQGSPWQALWKSMLSHVAAFGFTGDSRWTQNYLSLSLLPLPVALFFWLGVLATIRGWKRPAYRFSLIWLVLMLVPGLFAYEGNPPNFLRLAGAIPVIFVLTGLGIWQALAWLLERVDTTTRIGLWRGGFALVLVILSLGLGTRTYSLYFDGWARADELFTVYSVPVADLAADLTQNPPPENVLTVVPYSNFNFTGHLYNFEFLFDGDAAVMLARTADPAFPAQLRATIAAHDALVTPVEKPVIHAVQWYMNDSADVAGELRFLLGKYAEPAGRLDEAGYSVFRYRNPLLDREWAFYESLASQDVLYDSGFSLTHAAIGSHGGVQFTDEWVQLNAWTHPLWLVTRWQTARPIDQEYRLSLRLYNEMDERVHMEEYPIFDAFVRATDEWRTGAATETYQLFPALPNLAPGTYQLRILIYDLDTLAPAVQVNVWEPEVLLLTIEIGTGNERQ